MDTYEKNSIRYHYIFAPGDKDFNDTPSVGASVLIVTVEAIIYNKIDEQLQTINITHLLSKDVIYAMEQEILTNEL